MVGQRGVAVVVEDQWIDEDCRNILPLQFEEFERSLRKSALNTWLDSLQKAAR